MGVAQGRQAPSGRDGNGKETGKWISENIRDIRIRIRANPICFHPKRWKLEENTNMIIGDIRILIHANSIFSHTYPPSNQHTPTLDYSTRAGATAYGVLLYRSRRWV